MLFKLTLEQTKQRVTSRHRLAEDAIVVANLQDPAHSKTAGLVTRP